MKDKHHILMNELEFNMRYSIFTNPFSRFNGKLAHYFSPFGQELEFIRNADPACVWTRVIDDDCCVWLKSGYHYHNREGFIITNEPVAHDEQIEIKLD